MCRACAAECQNESNSLAGRLHTPRRAHAQRRSVQCATHSFSCVSQGLHRARAVSAARVRDDADPPLRRGRAHSANFGSLSTSHEDPSQAFANESIIIFSLLAARCSLSWRISSWPPSGAGQDGRAGAGAPASATRAPRAPARPIPPDVADWPPPVTMPPAESASLEAIRYSRGALALLDQRLLPAVTEYAQVADAGAGHDAIKAMLVRGAPAIAIAGALSLAVELVAHGWVRAFGAHSTGGGDSPRTRSDPLGRPTRTTPRCPRGAARTSPRFARNRALERRRTRPTLLAPRQRRTSASVLLTSWPRARPQ